MQLSASLPEVRLSVGAKIVAAFVPVVLVSLLWALFVYHRVPSSTMPLAGKSMRGSRHRVTHREK